MGKLLNLEKEDLNYITKKYIYSRIIVFSIFILSVMSLLVFIENISINIEILNKYYKFFDIEHYVNVAKYGYTHNYEYAFFPLFPMIIRVFYKLRITIIGTICFNLVIGYLTTIIIFKILSFYDYKNEVKKKLINFYLYSPITIFTIIPYTEGLFIFLTVITFYFYITKKNLYITGVLLGLCSMTRSFGAMLFFGIFIDLVYKYVKNKEFNLKNFISICKIYIPATLISIIYPIYLFIKMKNPLYFVEVQYIHWHRAKSNFFLAIYKELELMLNGKTTPVLNVINMYLLIFSIYLLIKTIIYFCKNKKEGYVSMIIYLILTFFFTFTTMRNDGRIFPTCSMYRYFLGLFPIYLANTLNTKVFYIEINKIFCIIVTICFGLNLFLA